VKLAACVTAVVLTGLLFISAFIGLMVATAGGAVSPERFWKPVAPLACEGEFRIETRSLSRRPGETSVQHNLYCTDASGAERDITMYTIWIAFLVYSGITFGAAAIVFVPLAVLISWKVSRAARRKTPPAPPPAPSSQERFDYVS
jgi:hypothetical protein